MKRMQPAFGGLTTEPGVVFWGPLRIPPQRLCARASTCVTLTAQLFSRLCTLTDLPAWFELPGTDRKRFS